MDTPKVSESIDISIVVPAYNSAPSTEELIRRVVLAMEKEMSKTFELIIVDDASTDETWSVLRKLRGSDKRVKLIRMLKNSGQHLATYCGLAEAKGDLVLTLDDDLQHPPEEITKLLRFMEENPECDVVMGVPTRSEKSMHRKWGSSLAMKLIDFTVGKPKGVKLTSFRLMTRPVVRAVLNFAGSSFTIGSLICHATARICNVAVDHSQRKHGRSGYNLGKLYSLALTNLFNYSILPLRIISYTGLIMSLVSFCYFLTVVYLRTTGVIQQAGFATITGLILFFAGLILFAFGIVGTYIGMIIKGIHFREKFIVREQDYES